MPEDLDQIKERMADGCNPRDCKLLLAREITSLYHGGREAEMAECFFVDAFTNKKVPEQAEALFVVLEQGTLYDCIRPLVNAKLIGSGGEFRRLISQGGIQKNGIKVEVLEEKLQSGDILRIGKRKFVRVETV